jgi:hypothetical protein
MEQAGIRQQYIFALDMVPRLMGIHQFILLDWIFMLTGLLHSAAIIQLITSKFYFWVLQIIGTNYQFIVAQAFLLFYTINNALSQWKHFSITLSTSTLMISSWLKFESATLMAGQTIDKPTQHRDSNQNLRCASLIYRQERKQLQSQFTLLGLLLIITKIAGMIV